ncbi:FAD-dependent oxidoreductase [Porcipelethomonas sp.]|uniref:FAD-dependent oxidoreductase n=1 Tax=Porcipelethomonas sp. TaxID=2981675 RepID=UPI003EF76D29
MKSVWQSDSVLPEFPELKEDIKTDVLIIGGGIAGILTAYFLSKNGINYILAEKDKICNGITSNTTAKITFQHGLIYHKLLNSFGTETAAIYLNANKAAFEKYNELCQHIDCCYELKDNYVYSVDDRRILEQELSALEKIGYNAEFCENPELPFKTAGAVRFPDQAQFNPLKFISAIAADLNIYENTFIREMKEHTAVTDKARIKFDKVIVTTHFPFINKHGSYFLKLYQHRSYVIALDNADKLNGMYVDESRTGFSFRNYNNFLLLGGNGHRTGKKTSGWDTLRIAAKKFYPNSDVKYFWAAQDCMSLDGMPYIGNYSSNTPDMYTACGFNKWGMTGAMLSAMILSELISGKNNEAAKIFSPSRNILKPQLFINGIEALMNLLTISNKRCPHMGCALKWNSAERSWDCPCHGSRFSENGKVLDNPANGNKDI